MNIPNLGEILVCKQEPNIEKDPNAVAIISDGEVVIHTPLNYRHYIK